MGFAGVRKRPPRARYIPLAPPTVPFRALFGSAATSADSRGSPAINLRSLWDLFQKSRRWSVIEGVLPEMRPVGWVLFRPTACAVNTAKFSLFSLTNLVTETRGQNSLTHYLQGALHRLVVYLCSSYFSSWCLFRVVFVML